MKLKLTLKGGDESRDCTVSCDATATVMDVALRLLDTPEFHNRDLAYFVAAKRGHITLAGRVNQHESYQLLDPLTPFANSGVKSGWEITLIPEFGNQLQRLTPGRGTVEILNGSQRGTKYSLISGLNTVGRDPNSRVFIEDRSVSRKHAMIKIDEQIVISDLGSANGILVDGKLRKQQTISTPTEVTVGNIRVLITPIVRPRGERVVHNHQNEHTRSPLIETKFDLNVRELPQPPRPVQPGRVPVLAMLAPMMMGGVLFAVTKSPLSLMMIAFSPMMMIGSWLDGMLSGKRKYKKELAAFHESLKAERDALSELRQSEVEVRNKEFLDTETLKRAINECNYYLWSRRPENSSFLELQLGLGRLPSRTEIKLPSRGETHIDVWREVEKLQSDFAEVDDVPVYEKLASCGSLGIAGSSASTQGYAIALVQQLAALHSPAEVQIAGVIVDELAQEQWRWLKWLPHVDPLASVLQAGALAKDAATAGELLGALEQLLFVRQKAAKTQIRSFQKRDHAPDSPVNELPNMPCIVVVVIDRQLQSTHKSRLITLGEQGPDAGIHLLWVADDINDVPAACRTFVAVEHDQYMSEAAAQVGYVRHRNTVMLSQLSIMGVDEATRSAKTLASVHDLATRVLDESDLPRTVNLQDLHSLDILAGAKPILQNWGSNTSIKSQWAKLQQQPEISLRAVIGQGEKHPLAVELRKHGPHALVGGTTGSGKSEFLQSWIMSLAANFSPDCLTFLLVDYKGGAAFAECVDLPHTVGLVTDLTPHLVKRALTSLRAELKYREEVLAEYGAKDLQGLEARRIIEAPPCLVIVIDEFAALATEVPEFVDGVIDIAQRGRSLGLHLIMATQRPAGVIKDNLRANTNLRVALRMADPDDSSDVIGVKEAAFFDVETPGRAALKIGAARLQHFQSAYLGGRNGNEKVKSPIVFRSFDFIEGKPLAALDSEQKNAALKDQKPRDTEVLRDGIAAAAAEAGIVQPRRPWLDPLPTRISVAELEKYLLTLQREDAGNHVFYIGLADHPETQSQAGIGIDLSRQGNIAFFGSSGTGKTTVLLTITALLSGYAANRPVHFYGIDASNGALT